MTNMPKQEPTGNIHRHEEKFQALGAPALFSKKKNPEKQERAVLVLCAGYFSTFVQLNRSLFNKF